MKLSDNTLTILKSFSGINQSIWVRPGNVLKTITPQKTVVAFAKVDETFEKAFGIYDLSTFIGCLSLFEKPELNFDNDKFMVITDETGAKATYTFCAENMVTQAPEKLKDLGKAVKFKLQDTVLKKILNAANVMSLPEIRFYTNDGKVMVECVNKENKASNKMMFEVGESDAKLDCTLQAENLKIQVRSYEVQVVPGMVHLSTGDESLKYWIAAAAEKK